MENKKHLSALDEYIRKVYTLILLLVPGSCLIAGITYTFEKVIGWFPTVNWGALIIFDITCTLYLLMGIYFIKTGISPDGEVKPEKLKAAKYFICIILLIQYNFILYMIPLENFWAFVFFFVTLCAFFLDYKLVAISGVEIFVSLVVSWFLHGNVTLPARDALFLPSMLNKVICLFLSIVGLFLITFFVNHFLVNAKKDEMEQNNERVTTMLQSVSELSERLSSAGNVLSGVSQNQSASVEELSATSESLLAGNIELSRRSDDSIENLRELQKWESIVNEHVDTVKRSSDVLLEKSKDSEEQLQSLKTVNAEVTDSMERTNEVAAKLSDAVKEIGGMINIIDEISSSTNLLALNASIEAARAGEAGKGFAVVATEVGNLANNTKQSLNQVSAVISQVQDNVSEMTRFVEQNSEKLNEQNQFLTQLFSVIQEMIQHIHASIEGITSMGDAHSRQSDVIRHTVQINESIAESIKEENEEFSNINGMVENTTMDVSQMTEQVNVLNEMIDQINRLLGHQ